MIILSGVTVCYLAQNKGRVAQLADRRRRGQQAEYRVSTELVLNTFFLVADGFYRRGGGTPLHTICRMLHADDAEVIDAVERLRLGGLLVQVTESEHREIMPAKPLDQVTLGELIAQARDAAKDQCVVHPALTALNERLSQAQRIYDESVNAVTVQALLSDIPD